MARYYSNNSLHFHALRSQKLPLFRLQDVLRIPYPSDSAIFCDVSDDCSFSEKADLCSNGVCQEITDLPHVPTNPIPAPVVHPATRCAGAFDGIWYSSQTSMLEHAGPEYNVTTTSATTFDVVCFSKCDLLSASGKLSSVDSTITLTAPNGTVYEGQLNSMSCGNLNLKVSDQPVWTLARPKSVYGPVRDTPLLFGSFLGSATTSFLPVGVAVLAQGLVLVAGNGNATFQVAPVNIAPIGHAGDSASILAIDPARGSVVRVLHVGQRIDAIRVNDQGVIAIAGSFGVATIGSYLDNNVRWNDSLAGVAPGPCGPCCAQLPAARDNPNCRVDIGSDGVVAAYVVSAPHSWMAFDSTGHRLGGVTQPNIAAGTDVAVHSASKQIFITYFYNGNTGKEPIVMPVLRALPYNMASTNYVAYGWDAHDLRRPGWPAYGDVADGRAVCVTVGGDDELYFVGWSDGGDTMFGQSAGNLNLSAPNIVGRADSFTQTSNMNGASRVSYVSRMHAATGQPVFGQLQLARLPTTKGNSYDVVAAAAAADGTVYLAATAACCIANRDNQTVNGVPVPPYEGGDATLMTLQSEFLSRPLWSAFSAQGQTGSAGGVDVATRGSLVAFAIISHSAMQSVKALPGTGCGVAGSCGYIAVLPHPL